MYHTGSNITNASFMHQVEKYSYGEEVFVSISLRNLQLIVPLSLVYTFLMYFEHNKVEIFLQYLVSVYIHVLV